MIQWLASRWLRRRGLAILALAVIVAVGTAGAIVAVGAADRTAGAYADYLERSEVGDVVVNPSTSTREIADVISRQPEVDDVTSDAVFNATVGGDESPQPRSDVGDQSTGSLFVRGSTDGRYLDMDRPAVRSGRMPTGPREAVITQHTADAGQVRIGDVLRIAFWEPLPLFPGPPPEGYASEEEFLAELIPPMGVEPVEIVGIVTPSNEALPDELYPRQLVIVSPDVAARYDCLPASPAPGSTFAELTAALHPPDCAVLYRFYSLSLAGGPAAVKPVLDEILRAAATLTEGLAEISDLEESGGEPPEYFLLATETDQERETVERAIRPTVGALLALAAATAAVTLALASLAATRELRTVRDDQRQWHQLGLPATPRALVVGTPLLVATLVGAAIGTVSGWLLGTGPFGLVRVVEPGPERRLGGVAVLAAIGICVMTILMVAITTAWSARRLDPPPASTRPRNLSRWIVARTGSVAVADGLRTASTHRTVPVVASGVLLTGAVVAALVYGASLSALLDTPRSYGWPWDIAAMAGSGYGDLDRDAAQVILDDDPDVSSWTAIGFINVVSLDGQPLMSVYGLDRSSTFELPVVRGSLPMTDDEIALGTATAASRGLEVDDTVTLGGIFEPREATVSGIVVFPTLGPILADRVSAGTGMLLPEALFDDEDLAGARGLAAFVGVDLENGADTPITRSRLQRELDGLDLTGIPTIPFPDPLRPPEIIDATSTRGVPLVVAAVLAVVTALGLTTASWASVGARRRDLAVLRALGFDGAQIRHSIHAQSIATTAVILAIGTPLGVIAGQNLWRVFAEQLGVVPDAASVWMPALVTIAGGILLALLAAQVPARLAARSSAAAGLNTE
ncbi:hypothetical protein BH20ACT2_BH20ACT2_23450 [soil metagenome]